MLFTIFSMFSFCSNTFSNLGNNNSKLLSMFAKCSSIYIYILNYKTKLLKLNVAIMLNLLFKYYLFIISRIVS